MIIYRFCQYLGQHCPFSRFYVIAHEARFAYASRSSVFLSRPLIVKETEICTRHAKSYSIKAFRSKHLGSSFCTNADAVTVSDPDEELQPHEADEPILHVPVMVHEVIECLQPKDGQTILDMTFGAGGHTKSLLHHCPKIKIIAVDRDPSAHEIAIQLSRSCSPGQVLPLLGRFSELDTLLTEKQIKPESLDGILFDLGSSSMQFDQPDRGFSLSKDGPLDMRMDGNRFPNQPTAADVVNHLDEMDLYKIIKRYGEERMARKISHAIVEFRYAFGKIASTHQLADIVSSVFVGEFRRDKLMRHAHVATKTFQALRIFVNNELNEFNCGLELAHKYLKPRGICVVISFHSLEDRIVKRKFHGIDLDLKKNISIHDYHRDYYNSNIIHPVEEMAEIMHKDWESIGKKVIIPGEKEVLENPRSRSAKLRAARKCEQFGKKEQ
ncbi:hypothetical protein CHS0354_034207 [Potamilus streckersoni]|uniref:Methyltransferase-like protein 15 n=1 Tax=Potamilus streckersoni TaxID=2493646 RepID=A0AAE0W5A8_9BIVA|nr:hypothetical protein CHS0354_034207 [Potamilus streckersoni]